MSPEREDQLNDYIDWINKVSTDLIEKRITKEEYVREIMECANNFSNLVNESIPKKSSHLSLVRNELPR